MNSGDKTADLAGPGISTYEEVEKILPNDYSPILSPLKRMDALFAVKQYIEENLCKELNLHMVQVPLIVDKDSGVNDYLDRDGSRTPIDFECGLGLDKKIQAQVVQAATKWKRMALRQFDCKIGEGICTDMRAVRKDYFLDHDHSSYVDQWDWERVLTADQRNLDFLKDIVKKTEDIYLQDEYNSMCFKLQCELNDIKMRIAYYLTQIDVEIQKNSMSHDFSRVYVYLLDFSSKLRITGQSNTASRIHQLAMQLMDQTTPKYIPIQEIMRLPKDADAYLPKIV